MRAVYYEEFGTPDVLKLGERPVPTPAADEVLVQVAAAGVNPIDRRLRNGELQNFFTREWPIIPGWDVAGRIVEVGSGVSRLEEGRGRRRPGLHMVAAPRHLCGVRSGQGGVDCAASPASSPSLRQLPCRS